MERAATEAIQIEVKIATEQLRQMAFRQAM
jgi:hypothetical protein